MTDAVPESVDVAHPGAEGSGAPHADAADRLILDEASERLAEADGRPVAVLGDEGGALSLELARRGATAVRSHQESLAGERALAAAALELGLDDALDIRALGPELLDGAGVVLLRLPRALAALDEYAETIARHAPDDVQVVAGGRLKHMSPSMNGVLARSFGEVRASLGRQKSRVLHAAAPLRPQGPPRHPRTAIDERTGITIVAHGAAFGGATVDAGTRLLLDHLPERPVDATLVDLACGTGVIGVHQSLKHPRLRVLASDDSAAAVASAVATARANGVDDRVTVERDDALGRLPDHSVRWITLNPPFHDGGAITTEIAQHLVRDAARALVPGGELWTVYNSALGYRGLLEHHIGPTRQVARDRRFTVVVSTRRD